MSSSLELAPDECNPYADQLTDPILFYKVNDKKPRVSSVSLTIDKAFANTQRWFMTLLVSSQALPPGVTFRLTPRADLAYLQTLHYVSTYPGMSLDRFLMYHNESLREIIVSYNKDFAGVSLDPVLKVVIITLNGNLINFHKLFSDSIPVDKLAPVSAACAVCDKFKKPYEETRSENTSKAKRITSLEKQIARLETRLSANDGGYRPNSNRGGSNRGGFNRGGGCDYDHDHDRDRDRDQDRDRDTKSRKRVDPSSTDTKNP